MGPSDAASVLTHLRAKRLELDEVRTDLERGELDHGRAGERLRRWRLALGTYIEQHVSTSEAQPFTKSHGAFILGNPHGSFMMDWRSRANRLDELIRALERDPSSVVDMVDPEEAEQDEVRSRHPLRPPRTVFIVHGHDETNVLRLREFLRDDLGVADVIVLSGQPERGRVLLHKFEEEAQRADYAVVLCTPDDHVTDDAGNTYEQPRPNVLYELGWFVGHLGRPKVCVVAKHGVALHSDFAGFIPLLFQERVQEVSDRLRKELREAGFALRA